MCLSCRAGQASLCKAQESPAHNPAIIVLFSGGKDSLACVLDLLERGVPREKMELWHHGIDGGHPTRKEDFLDELRKEQAERRFTITGVLLDSGSPGMEFSLKKFCQNIYRTSELAGEEIVRELVSARI